MLVVQGRSLGVCLRLDGLQIDELARTSRVMMHADGRAAKLT